jgi:multicomponent Na+:H+ antiporter subunit F
MIDSDALLSQTAAVCMGVLAFTLGLCFLRLRRGPTLADRVLALDLMTTVLMGLIGVYAVYSRQRVFVDVTVVLALVAFISTVIFARHIERDAARADSLESAKKRGSDA